MEGKFYQKEKKYFELYLIYADQTIKIIIRREWRVIKHL